MHTREPLEAAIIKKVAAIEGVTATSVRRVLNDKQNNKQVYRTYLLLGKEIENAIEGVELVRIYEKEMQLIDNNPINHNQ